MTRDAETLRRYRRWVAYAGLITLYFVFGVIGGQAPSDSITRALALNVSAGFITGFVVLLLQAMIEGRHSPA